MKVIAHGIYRFRELPVTSPTIARSAGDHSDNASFRPLLMCHRRDLHPRQLLPLYH